MKLATIFIFMTLLTGAIEKVDSNAVVGVWETGNGKARVKIDRQGEKFHGKIVWLREPLNDEGKPKVDKNNPDESLRTKPLLGYSLLKDFTFSADDKQWQGGTIYDPESGSTYSCTMQLKDENTLEVRGFIGVSLFGKTDTWKRVQVKKKQ